jgi:hypothetical protein
MSTPDPQPGRTPGPRHGSVEGVRPGVIPPAEARGTAGVSPRESPAWQVGSKAFLIVIAALGGVVALVFAALAVVWLSRI